MGSYGSYGPDRVPETKVLELQELFEAVFPEECRFWKVEALNAQGRNLRTIVQAPSESELDVVMRSAGYYTSNVEEHDLTGQ